MVSGLAPAGTVSPMGLDRLCRSSRSQAASASAASAKTKRLALEREDIEHASRRGLVRQILRRIGKAQRASPIARVHFGGDYRAGPSADARDHRDILAPVRTAIAD